jgi:hypothetical protein
VSRPQQYYVVNVGRGRLATHISTERVSGLFLTLWSGPGLTLCGLRATRHVDVFRPSEASCRECRKRWQLAIQDAHTPRPAVPRPADEEPAFNLLARTTSQLRRAGVRARGWRRYSVMSPQDQRAWLARYPHAAARLFPDGIPGERS